MIQWSCHKSVVFLSLERVCSTCNKLYLFWGKAALLENVLHEEKSKYYNFAFMLKQRPERNLCLLLGEGGSTADSTDRLIDRLLHSASSCLSCCFQSLSTVSTK